MVGIEKYHGTGNDFVVVDAAEDVPDRRAFARSVCDRRTGISHPSSDRIGADGVLFLALEEAYTPPRVIMTLVNPDGSVAAMCGNGARCAASWAVRRIRDGTPVEPDDNAEVMIDTPAGSRRAVVADGRVSIDMGTPTFLASAVPVAGPDELVEREVEGLTVTAVNTGVPHAVAFVDDVADVDLADVGPRVRHADVFPEGANVTVAARRDDGDFDQRTYERGVENETDSCGTGAVAVAAVAHRLGLVTAGERVAIHPPGGRLVVSIDDVGATLAGPVVHEFDDDVALGVEAVDD